MADPYLDENGILINKLNLNNWNDLNQKEKMASSARLTELNLNSPQPPFDFYMFKKIHYHLFQDIYNWAGEVRTCSLKKREFVGSGNYSIFTEPSEIAKSAQQIFKPLKNIEKLKQIKTKDFFVLLAEFFVSINKLHPFREGNGRTQQTFIRLLAQACGYELTWRVTTRERMINVSMEGMKNNIEPAKRLFTEIINPQRVKALEKVINFLEKNDIDFNDWYISTSVKDHHYVGNYAGTDGENIMINVKENGQNKLIIGCLKDIDIKTQEGDEISFKSTHF